MSSNPIPGTGPAGGDIVEILKQDHQRVDHLLDQIEGTTDADEERRAQLFAHVAAELEVHSDAEDQIVYAALEGRDDYVDMVEDARQEHEHIEQMVEELDRTAVTDSEWIGKVRELRQLVRHHVDGEEGTILPRLTQAFGDGERRRLAEDFLSAKESEEEPELSGIHPAVSSPFDSEPDIESLSKRELYELARTRHIEGRSAMSKAELVQAIRAAR
jgi:hypothetical protein